MFKLWSWHLPIYCGQLKLHKLRCWYLPTEHRGIELRQLCGRHRVIGHRRVSIYQLPKLFTWVVLRCRFDFVFILPCGYVSNISGEFCVYLMLCGNLYFIIRLHRLFQLRQRLLPNE